MTTSQQTARAIVNKRMKVSDVRSIFSIDDPRNQFPLLFHKGKSGALIQWRVWSEGSTIFTEHGQVNGQLQISSKIAEPKNIGRANATTAVEQAQLEAKAMWQHKRDRKYSESPAEAQQSKYLPMLAHSFEARKTGMIYPVFVQPKLDGFRCLAFKEDDKVTLYSRSGDEFDLPHISDELNQYLPEGSVVDGELYCHKVPFQKVASWIKKQHPETKRIGYHIYDVPEMGGRNDLPMTDRVKLLEVLESHKWNHIDIVETLKANNQEQVYEAQTKFVADGYEGAIVRLYGGRYRYDYRSYELLKVKSFSDGEYQIIGGRPGVGKMATHCIFECVTPEGKKFSVVPRGTADERAAYLKNLRQYIGKPLTVRYFGMSEDGVPRFPVGIAIREDFDK